MADMNPLNIREIVAIVFENYVDKQRKELLDPIALVSCAQVNYLWFEMATYLLWAHSQLKALAQMDQLRRPVYAAKCRYLDDHEQEATHQYLMDLDFPHLQSACFMMPEPSLDRTRLQYLVPSLRVLKIYDIHERRQCTALSNSNNFFELSDHDLSVRKDHLNWLSDDTLQQIQERCPDLIALEIEAPLTQTQADSLFKLIQNKPLLRRISIYLTMPKFHRKAIGKPDEKICDHLFSQLGHFSQLHHLAWHVPITKATVQEALESQDDLFSQLQRLDCRADFNIIEPLLYHLSAITSLELSLINGFGHISSLSNCHNLRKLCVYQRGFKSNAKPAEFIQMARGCPRLEQLTIHGEKASSGLQERTNDDVWEALASCLSELKVLKLMNYWYGSQFSVTGLISQGRNCRRLEDLEVDVEGDLTPLQTYRQVLFPHLEHLKLGRAPTTPSWQSRPATYEYAVMLYYHAPQLDARDFTFDEFSPTSGSDLVSELFRKLHESPHQFFTNLALANLRHSTNHLIRERNLPITQDQVLSIA